MATDNQPLQGEDICGPGGSRGANFAVGQILSPTVWPAPPCGACGGARALCEDRYKSEGILAHALHAYLLTLANTTAP